MAGDSPLKRCIDCDSEGVTTQRKTPHPGPRCATHNRLKRRSRKTYSHDKHIGETYGITTAEYWSIYEFQDGTCAICQRATGVSKRLSVDHCHDTGVVRGLLCQRCNRNVLGHLRDDVCSLARAINYLESPPAVEVIGVRITPDMRKT